MGSFVPVHSSPITFVGLSPPPPSPSLSSLPPRHLRSPSSLPVAHLVGYSSLPEMPSSQRLSSNPSHHTPRRLRSLSETASSRPSSLLSHHFSRRLRALPPVACALSLPSPSRSPSPRLRAFSPLAFGLSIPSPLQFPLSSVAHFISYPVEFLLFPPIPSFTSSPFPSRLLRALSALAFALSPPRHRAHVPPSHRHRAQVPPLPSHPTFASSHPVELFLSPPIRRSPPLSHPAFASSHPVELFLSPPIRRSPPLSHPAFASSHPVEIFLSPPIRRSLPLSHPVVRLLFPPIPSFLLSPLSSRRSFDLPSHPLVITLFSPLVLGHPNF
ncbi:unnamed protein product [Closterium sp. NIES-64]|nr:unnamed protein product [Closterium sp. NIES-64]CAI5999178.1 unnamed protein product [Closterium sp. NIES-65]